MKERYLWFIVPVAALLVFCSCGVSNSGFTGNKKYAPRQLEKDYSIFRNLLEESHPGLYWYTSKDTMDYYFNWGERQIMDSLTEPQFRKVLSYVLSKMDCGHTTTRASKKYIKYLDTLKSEKFFPLSLRVWPDTAAVALNLIRKDTFLKKGTLIRSINQVPIKKIEDSLFRFISADGYNLTHKYQTLSNRGGFGAIYTSVYGLQDRYQVEYTDSLGHMGTTSIPPYDPSKDTVNRAAGFRRLLHPPSARERRTTGVSMARQLRLDTADHVAFMDLNTFARGYHLRNFFKKSFRALSTYDIKYLVVDVRNNGGGSVTNSTILSKYLAQKKFKIADTLYAINRNSRYHAYIKQYFFNRLFMLFFTKRKSDGHYHFHYFEKHYFNIKKQNHFDGETYIITGGNSFSATTLFANAVINQNNVTVVGEETGGGAYGNTAWLIPDVKLPETKIQFRLPLFRLVMDKDRPKTGHGIIPEVEAGPSIDAVRKNRDPKIETVMRLIHEDMAKKH
jgi:hypothetical protein